MKKTLLLLPLSLLALLSACTVAPTSPLANAPLVESTDTPSARINIFSSDRTLGNGRFYFTDQDYGRRAKFPDWLEGTLFFESSSRSSLSYRCLREGLVLAFAPINRKRDLSQKMESLGFRLTSHPFFQLFGNDAEYIYGVFEKQLHEGETFTLPPRVILAGFDVPRTAPTGAGETLYNGIQLPDVWPPSIDWDTDKPPEAPWIKNRPDVVPIDIGRQLFFDDFLIENTDLSREFHYPEKFSGNPVLKPETELECSKVYTIPPPKAPKVRQAGAMPKSGGLWWNPEKQLFELWYEAGWLSTIAYATSRDGIKWDRPNLPLRPGTNQVLPGNLRPDSWTVVRDPYPADPDKKFKIFMNSPNEDNHFRVSYFTSPDGIKWSEPGVGGINDDRSTMFYNPFRKKWIFSLRWNSPGDRSRAYWEDSDFERGINWLPDQPVPWARSDRRDSADSRVGDTPQLYNLDAVAYESIMLGFFQLHFGPKNDIAGRHAVPKFTGLNFAYSRDGFNWHRPDRKIAINSEHSAGKWDRGYVQSLGNICVIRGDKIWFYYIGFSGTQTSFPGDSAPETREPGMHVGGATGVAILRRDGFASMNSNKNTGTLTTRPIRFSGSNLFVNVSGTLSAEACDESGNPIEPFTFANSIPFTGDSTIAPLSWKNGDISSLANKTIRLRFKLNPNTKLYSFWVSRDTTGRSDGYVAGGGPGYTAPTDTVGKAALDAEANFSKK